MRHVLRVAALGLMLSLLACGGGGGSGGAVVEPAPPPTPAMVAGLRCSGAANTGWCWQAPQPWGHLVRDVLFISAAEGVAAGDGGLLLRTHDGGRNWSEQFLPDSPPLQALAFADAKTGWLLGRDQGRIWRTDDGGATWSALPRLPFDRGLTLQRVGAQTVVATGSTAADPYARGSAISDDGGRSWRGSARAVEQVQPNGSMWAVDYTLGLLESTDGGRSFGAPRGWTGPWQAMWWGLDAGGAVWTVQWPDSVDGLLAHSVSWRLTPDGAWTRTPMGSMATAALQGLSLFPQGGWALEQAASPMNNRWWHWNGPGSDWQPFALPDGLSAIAVTRYGWLDVDTAWFQAYAGGPRPVDLTTDGGRTWVRDIGQPAGTADAVRRLTRDGGGGLLMAYGGGYDDVFNTWPVERWYRSGDGGRSWLALPGNQAPDDPVAGLHFFDDLRGVGVTAQGAWLSTTDGGRHWQRQAVDLQGVDSLQFTSDGSGWVVAAGRVKRTRDGGLIWSVLPLPSELDHAVVRLQWVDDRNGFLTVNFTCGRHVCALKLHATTDGGATWQERPDPEGNAGFVQMRTADIGVRFANGQVWRTSDGARSWQAATFVTVDPMVPQRVRLLADASWLALSADHLLRSDDDGRSWRDVPLPRVQALDIAYGGSTSMLRDLAFADAANGWIVGHDGSILASTDGGRSWTRQTSGAQAHLTAVVARPGGRVWAGGAYGTVLATASGGR